MDNARLAFLFNKYIQQTSTEAERDEFIQLIARSESDQQLKDIMKDLWESANEQPIQAETAEAIFSSILKEGTPVIPIEKKIKRIWWRSAAAVLIFVLSSAALYFYVSRETTQSLAGHERPLPEEHQIIKLADGSIVTLNAGSKLEYPESFEGRSSREVHLTGEGYFDIQHDPKKSFIVHTGLLKTTVLGTAFNIKAYTNEKNITVTVTRGKVKVSDDKNILGTITPDQQITFNKESQQSIRQNVQSRNFTTWADRDIFFDDATLQEAVILLEERFQVRIRLANEKIKDCRFTATFVRGEELDQILTVISEFNRASFTRISEREILIEGDGCQ